MQEIVYLVEFHKNKGFKFDRFKNGWMLTVPFCHLFKIVVDNQEFVRRIGKMLRPR
jgi:hypothetical protein